MKKLLLILAVLATLLFLGKRLSSEQPLFGSSSVMLVNPYPASSPLHADHQSFVDRFNGNQKLRERYSGAFTSKGLYAAWQSALRHGARTLPGERLIEVTRSQVAILPRMSEAGCARMIRPRDDFDEVLGADIRQAIEQLPPRHHRAITSFFYDSLLSEVEGHPERPADEQAYGWALQSLGERYPGEYGERLLRVMKDPVAASDEDACWAINSLLHTATQLPPDHAEAFLRRTLGG